MWSTTSRRRLTWLLEIVHYNIANMQYVCAGDLRALDTLAGVTNFIKMQNIDVEEMRSNIEEAKECAPGDYSRDAPRQTLKQAPAAGAGAWICHDSSTWHRRAFPLDLFAIGCEAIPILPAQEDQQDDD